MLRPWTSEVPRRGRPPSGCWPVCSWRPAVVVTAAAATGAAAPVDRAAAVAAAPVGPAAGVEAAAAPADPGAAWRQWRQRRRGRSRGLGWRDRRRWHFGQRRFGRNRGRRRHHARDRTGRHGHGRRHAACRVGQDLRLRQQRHQPHHPHPGTEPADRHADAPGDGHGRPQPGLPGVPPERQVPVRAQRGRSWRHLRLLDRPTDRGADPPERRRQRRQRPGAPVGAQERQVGAGRKLRQRPRRRHPHHARRPPGQPGVADGPRRRPGPHDHRRRRRRKVRVRAAEDGEPHADVPVRRGHRRADPELARVGAPTWGRPAT